MTTTASHSGCRFPDFPPEQLLLAPSVLAADFARLGEEVQAVDQAGAEVLHLDVMDGHFVPNISFGADVIHAVRGRSPRLFDAHLMISDPRKYLERFQKAGVDHITFHVEIEDDIHEVIRQIHAMGITAGLSLRPGTSYEALLPYLDEVELLLVMTVEPGFGGQSFRADQLPKIEALRKLIDATGRNIHLEVDGGIAEATARLVRSAGANALVAGSSVFHAKSGYAAALAALRS